MKKDPKFTALKIATLTIYPTLLSDEKIINAVKEFVTDYPYFSAIKSDIMEISLRAIGRQRDYE